MPTAATAKTTTTRKRRTRKTTTPKSTAKVIKEIQAVLDAPTPKSLDKVATPVKKTPVKRTRKAKVSTTKYQQPVEIKKVTETKATRVRPAKPNLTIADYTADIKVRWEIHQWETQELWNDVVKGYNNLKPVVAQSVDYVKDSYSRAFN